jgi:hypothetical protein
MALAALIIKEELRVSFYHMKPRKSAHKNRQRVFIQGVAKTQRNPLILKRFMITSNQLK